MTLRQITIYTIKCCGMNYAKYQVTIDSKLNPQIFIEHNLKGTILNQSITEYFSFHLVAFQRLKK